MVSLSGYLQYECQILFFLAIFNTNKAGLDIMNRANADLITYSEKRKYQNCLTANDVNSMRSVIKNFLQTP